MLPHLVRIGAEVIASWHAHLNAVNLDGFQPAAGGKQSCHSCGAYGFELGDL
jgi:hypothetical protein